MKNLVYQIVLLIENSRGEETDVLHQTLDLVENPPPALLIEFSHLAPLFDIDMDVVEVVNIDALTYEEGFEFLFLCSGTYFHNITLAALAGIGAAVIGVLVGAGTMVYTALTK